MNGSRDEGYPPIKHPMPTPDEWMAVQKERDSLLLQNDDLKKGIASITDGAAKYRDECAAMNRLISEMKAEAERKDKLWEDATVKNLEAVTELIEALAPFYLHGMVLRGTILPENATINKVGSSYLVKGAFETAIEAFQKWQDLLEGKERPAEKRAEGPQKCGAEHAGGGVVCNLDRGHEGRHRYYSATMGLVTWYEFRG